MCCEGFWRQFLPSARNGALNCDPASAGTILVLSRCPRSCPDRWCDFTLTVPQVIIVPSNPVLVIRFRSPSKDHSTLKPSSSYSAQEECREPDVLLKPCSEVGGKMAVVRLPDGGLRLA